MDILSVWQQALIANWDQFWSAFLWIFPSILGSMLVFSSGMVLAFWTKRLFIEIARRAGLDNLSNNLGISKSLLLVGMKSSLIQVISTFIEWLIILVFFLAAIDILGLNAVKRSFIGFLTYIPNLFSAVLIFAVGYFIAGLTEKLVRLILFSHDRKLAKILVRLSHGVMIVISFFTAINQLQITPGLITTFYQGLTYTLVLVVGLSVGLGTKDIISRIWNEWYEDLKK
jgi:hypothetical protein